MGKKTTAMVSRQLCPERFCHVSTKLQRHDRCLFLKRITGDHIVRHIQQFFSLSLKASLVLVAFGEAALIFLSDFSGYMFDVVILSLAFGMTMYCFIRAIRNYSSDVRKLGL
jgi:hypothetical protein